MPGFELFGDEERKEVNDVLETGILMRYGFDGPRKGIWKSKELEAAICARFGTEYAQLTSSGTAALTTAMAALGVGAGDEVIMPAFTFVASFEAVLSMGAVPVLVDIDESLTLAPDAVKAAITSKTKCVMFSKTVIDVNSVRPIMLDNLPLPFVNEIKHLGNVLQSDNSMTKDCSIKRACFISKISLA